MMFFPSRKPKKSFTDLFDPTPLLLRREEQLERLQTTEVDILIAGGGVTGAYTAFDAALRGYRVALVEKDDFASGTSSKSSKMVHGGLRYIEQGNLRLVRHSLLERQRLRRNARHLVQRLPFLFPILDKNGVFDKRLATAFEGLLWTYDLAGGWREGILHQKLTPAEVLSHCPTLREEMLSGGFLYFDARVDDARLTLALVKTAAKQGAIVVNHAEVISTTHGANGKVNGVVVHTEGKEITVHARTVVLATGVWLRDWKTRQEQTLPSLNVRPAKGVHVAIPWLRIRNDCTVTIPVPGRSRRATITRWGDVSYLGTTDEDYDGDLNEMFCTRRELDFLLEGANSALKTDLTPEDVVGSIAGCRPLVGSSSGKTVEMKRNHYISTAADGLIIVVGGKLTTSRHMAEQTINVAGSLLDDKRRCTTKSAFLLGAAGYDPQAIIASGGLSAHLGERYGTEAHFVSALLQGSPVLQRPVVAGLPYSEAEVLYAIRHELACTVDDILSRRLRARLMARDASAVAAARVGEILQSELGLSDQQVADQVNHYRAEIQREKSYLTGE